MKAPALYDDQRATLFRWGLSAIVAACALAPLCGESSMQHDRTSPVHTLSPAALPAASTPAPAVLNRDPFVPRAIELPGDVAVRAVVMGAKPHALVDIGAQTILVGVGDEVGGARVVTIDDTGVRLTDGTLIRFESNP